jgi:hypothetical protein
MRVVIAALLALLLAGSPAAADFKTATVYSGEYWMVSAFACFQAVAIHFHNGGKSGCFPQPEAFSIEKAGNVKLPVLNQAVVDRDQQHLRSLLSVSRSQEELDSALIAAAGVGRGGGRRTTEARRQSERHRISAWLYINVPNRRGA